MRILYRIDLVDEGVSCETEEEKKIVEAKSARLRELTGECK